MNAREMRNIKKPVYACKMGKGLFAGGTYSWWICQNCGKQVQYMSSDGNRPPEPRFGVSSCPDSSSGNHVWRKA